MPKLERPPCGSGDPMSTQEREAGDSMMQDARYLEGVTQKDRKMSVKHKSKRSTRNFDPSRTSNHRPPATPFLLLESLRPCRH
jgi:hypothetical protein